MEDLDASAALQQQGPPKWKIISMDMTARCLHAGFVYNDSTLLYWGGRSQRQEDIISRQFCETYGELVMVDSISNKSIVPTVSGEIPSPGERDAHIFISDFEEKYAYLIGGGNQGQNDGSYRLCLSTFEWKKLKFKFNLTCSSAASIPGFIFIFGGREFGEMGFSHVSDTMYRYDIKNNKLQKLKKATPSPPERSKACLTSICNGKYLLLFGGDRGKGSCLNDLWLFECATLKWTEIKQGNNRPKPMAFCGWSKVNIYGKERAMVLFGGVEISGRTASDIWSLDLNTLTWEIVVTSSKSMKVLSAHCNLVTNKKLYVYGGIENDPHTFMYGALSNKVYCFDMSYHYRNLKNDLDLFEWQCVECHSFTENKTKCGKLKCCSEDCEKKYREKYPIVEEPNIATQPLCNKIEHNESPNMESNDYQGLKNKVNQLEKLLETKSTEMASLVEKLAEIDTLKKSLAERDTELEQIKKQREDLLKSNQKYEKTIENLRKEKVIIENTSKEQKKEFDKKTKALNETVQEKTKKSQQLEKTVQDLTQTNKSIETEKTRQVKQMEEQSNTIQKLQQSNTVLESKVKNLQMECTQLQSQTHQFLCDLEEKEKENQDLICKLGKYYDELEEMGPKENEQHECIICMDNKVDHIMIPCGHAFCFDCIEHQNNCPTCRASIMNRVKMFIN